MVTPNFSKELQPIFETLVSSDNPLEQIQAAYEIGNFHDSEEAFEALIRGLIIPDSDVMLTILDILMQPAFFSEKLVPPIINLVDDKDSEVRKQAAEILGMTKDLRSVPPLLKLLKDSDCDVRFATMASLANIGELESALELEKCLDSKEWEDRYHAIDAIGMLANPMSANAFIRAFNDENFKVRENAALSAGFYDKHPEVVQKLIELLDDAIVDVQAAAAYTLGDFKTKEAVPHLIEFLESESEDLVLIAIESLAKIKDPSSIYHLVKLLNHSKKEISVAAQEALDVFRNIVIIDPIVEALKEDTIIQYIAHRIKKFPDQTGNNLATNKSLKELNLPMWLEMLIIEILLAKESI